MENKILEQAKDAVAKNMGYKDWNDYSGYGYTTNDFTNKVALKYHELMNEWVSVKTYLPSEELEGEQLILELGYNDNTTLVICGYYEDGMFFNLETKDYLDNVIRWKPLPPPINNKV